MAQFNLKNFMQQMSGLFNKIIQSTKQPRSQDGAQTHTAVSLLLPGLTDSKKFIEGLDFSRLIVNEIEDELMAEADDGETTKPDNEMDLVESCSAEQLKTLLGGMADGVSAVCTGSGHPHPP